MAGPISASAESAPMYSLVKGAIALGSTVTIPSYFAVIIIGSVWR